MASRVTFRRICLVTTAPVQGRLRFEVVGTRISDIRQRWRFPGSAGQLNPMEYASNPGSLSLGGLRAARPADGSWEAPFRFFACIGTMNQAVLVLVLETKRADRGRERERGGGRRVGSWKVSPTKLYHYYPHLCPACFCPSTRAGIDSVLEKRSKQRPGRQVG